MKLDGHPGRPRTDRSAKPIIAARPFHISALAWKIPVAFFSGVSFFRRGMKVATMKVTPRKAMVKGKSCTSLKTFSPVIFSRRIAELNPSMASLPFASSGTGPEKLIRFPKVGVGSDTGEAIVDFGAESTGVLPSSPSDARTTTVRRRGCCLARALMAARALGKRTAALVFIERAMSSVLGG
eukprot:scaffold128_cov328-Pavlova_lutheri.AAC.37